ncbi:MAG: flagellar hook-length control protein FliK [Pseudomonadota bacterium]
MEELQLALTSARVDQRNFGLWINNWQVGQTLNVLVTSQLPTGELVLRVAGSQITATADIPVQQGANLLLEVKQLQPVPTLRVLNHAGAAAAPNVGGTLQLLPSSGAAIASQPLAAVAEAAQAVRSNASLPALVAAPLGQLLQQVSSPQQLSQPAGVSTAVNTSGIFLESHLLTASDGRAAPPPSDMKASFFRALSAIDAALGRVEALGLPAADIEMLLEMRRELEAGLGRITLQQLNSQPTEGAARQWQLEIPVQLGDSFHSIRVSIEHEGGQRGDAADSDEEEQWSVSLRLAPPALGEVELLLRLKEDSLELRTAAARPEVRALIDVSLPELVTRLASRGITLQTLSAASMIEGAGTPAVLAEGQLDIRA